MLLAIDTSGAFCSAAIARGDTTIAARSENIGRGHAERLMPLLEELLAEAQVTWSQFSKLACTTGPGSFTGLRVGLATARGLALALDCPCQGVSVFDAFAYSHTGPLAVTIDARRDQIWMQLYREGGVPASAPTAVGLDAAIDNIPEYICDLTGSAAPLLSAQSSRFNVVCEALSPPIDGVVGGAMRGAFDGSLPEPLYLRMPDAKPQSNLLSSIASTSGANG